jgi:hypothetical protein
MLDRRGNPFFGRVFLKTKSTNTTTIISASEVSLPVPPKDNPAGHFFLHREMQQKRFFFRLASRSVHNPSYFGERNGISTKISPFFPRITPPPPKFQK